FYLHQGYCPNNFVAIFNKEDITAGRYYILLRFTQNFLIVGFYPEVFFKPCKIEIPEVFCKPGLKGNYFNIHFFPSVLWSVCFQGSLPSISISKAKLRNVLISTIRPRFKIFSRLASKTTVIIMSAATRNSSPNRIALPSSSRIF